MLVTCMEAGAAATLQDKVDDARAGVKSTALLFGDRTKPVLATFAGSQIALLALAGGVP